MDLEQRVKALEYEMKILKNEIQRTLLDIQEQILIHYYPALRTDDAVPSDGTIQAMEAVRAKQGPAPAPGGTPAPGAPPVAPAPSQSAPPAAPPSAPPPSASLGAPAMATVPIMVAGAAPAVVLDQVRPVQGQATAVPTAASDPTQTVKLVDWAMGSATRLGGKRTDTLIELCRAHGFMTPDVQEMLSKVIAFAKDTAPEGIPTNQILTDLLKLIELLHATATVDDALVWIEEAKLG